MNYTPKVILTSWLILCSPYFADNESIFGEWTVENETQTTWTFSDDHELVVRTDDADDKSIWKFHITTDANECGDFPIEEGNDIKYLILNDSQHDYKKCYYIDALNEHRLTLMNAETGSLLFLYR
jgi:hypothetical protein